jgi:hypothetical protein
VRLLLVVFFALVLPACMLKPAATPPSVVPASPPGDSAGLQSGGFGLTKTEWEKEHGSPNRTIPGGILNYESDQYMLTFTNERVTNLSRAWGAAGAVIVDVARAESKNLIPKDAAFVRTFQAQSTGVVDLYTSQWLKAQLPNGPWQGGEPGNFIVGYRQPPAASGKVSAIFIAPGNNP